MKSLHTKLVFILVALVIAVMTIVGTFLVNSVTEYNISRFKSEMAEVFTPDFILTLEEAGNGEYGYLNLQEHVMAYSGTLGISKNRNFYILDGKTGEYLAGSDAEFGKALEMTPNILTAMNGDAGNKIVAVGKYFDVAIPVVSSNNTYVIGVMDTKSDLNAFTVNMVEALVRAMVFGLVIVILLSFLLSKTITNPVAKLTNTATKIAAGNFDDGIVVESNDEIGVLTQTFNEMAVTLKDTLNAIEGERNKLETMFTHMKDGIVAFDKNGNMIHINPAAQKMLGVDMDHTKHYGTVFKNLHVDKEDLNSTGKYIEIDYAAQGSMLKLFIAPFDSGDGGGLIAVLHDITEQHRLDESRREFVANVSHELRTPLTNIKGYTETLLEADDIDDETKKSFLTVVHNESDRMTRIVKDLLTLSRLDHGKVDMKESLLDVSQLIRNAVSTMALEAKNHGLTLGCETKGTLKVTGDGERLMQVIINIISNAIKYNQPNGKIDVSAFLEEEKVQIIIKDTGLGIPEEDLPRIFERFYRVDKARSREKGGTGLGLAIAKEIIEQHGGSVSISSIYGQGTAVTIALPKAEEE